MALILAQTCRHVPQQVWERDPSGSEVFLQLASCTQTSQAVAPCILVQNGSYYRNSDLSDEPALALRPLGSGGRLSPEQAEQPMSPDPTCPLCPQAASDSVPPPEKVCTRLMLTSDTGPRITLSPVSTDRAGSPPAQQGRGCTQWAPWFTGSVLGTGYTGAQGPCSIEKQGIPAVDWQSPRCRQAL